MAKGYFGARKIKRYLNSLDQFRNDGITSDKYSQIEKELLTLKGDSQATKDTKSGVDRVLETLVTYVSKDAKAPAKQKTPVYTAIPPKKMGDKAIVNPSSLRAPRSRGYDPSVTIGDSIYYLKDGVPEGWKGDFELTGTTSRNTAFHAKAYLPDTSLEKRLEKPDVSLSNVDPSQVAGDRDYILPIKSGGSRSKPWVVILKKTDIEKMMLGEIFETPERWMKTKPQREAYDSLKHDLNSGKLTIRIDGTVHDSSTPLYEIFKDELTEINAVTIQGKKKDKKKNKPNKPIIKKTSVSAPTRPG